MRLRRKFCNSLVGMEEMNPKVLGALSGELHGTQHNQHGNVNHIKGAIQRTLSRYQVTGNQL